MYIQYIYKKPFSTQHNQDISIYLFPLEQSWTRKRKTEEKAKVLGLRWYLFLAFPVERKEEVDSSRGRQF